MKKVYLSGPMSGRTNWNRDAFMDAQARVGKKDVLVFNPHFNGVEMSAPWKEHMRADIRNLMDCDILVQLPEWELSRGARLEWEVAKAIGLEIYTLSEFIYDANTP